MKKSVLLDVPYRCVQQFYTVFINDVARRAIRFLPWVHCKCELVMMDSEDLLRLQVKEGEINRTEPVVNLAKPLVIPSVMPEERTPRLLFKIYTNLFSQTPFTTKNYHYRIVFLHMSEKSCTFALVLNYF